MHVEVGEALLQATGRSCGPTWSSHGPLAVSIVMPILKIKKLGSRKVIQLAQFFLPNELTTQDKKIPPLRPSPSVKTQRKNVRLERNGGKVWIFQIPK